MTSSLDMIRGRSNVVTLTNKSGGPLVAGDVCVIDTTTDEAATTTTSAASVLKVYIADESIANNATGKFYSAGFCPLVTPSASTTRGRYLFTHTVAKQAAESATYGAGAFGVILKSGTTPSVWLFGTTAQGTGGTFGGTTGSTDNAVLRADGTGGATIQSSLATVDDSGTVNIPTGQTYNINNTPHTHAGGAGALILLEQHAGAGVTTPTLDFTTWYSASYDSYLIDLVNVIPANNAVNMVMPFSTDGGGTWDVTGGNYVGGGLLAHSAGVGQQNFGAGAGIYLVTANVSNSSNYGVCAKIYLYSPGSTALYKTVITHVSYFDSSAGHVVLLEGTTTYGSTTAVNGIRFKFSAGDVASGNIRVYGIAK